MQIRLKVLHGSKPGKEVKITGKQFVIGRAEDCNLRPKSDAISRKHCAFFLHDDKACVRDLGSRNGTSLNGQTIKSEQVLSTADELRMGPLHFEVILTDDSGNIIPSSRITSVVESSSNGDRGDSGIISDWLVEEDEKDRSKRVAEPETRQFRLDETTCINMAELKKKQEEAERNPQKKEPGKLPKVVKKDEAEDTQQAAAQTLRKLFNRGT